MAHPSLTWHQWDADSVAAFRAAADADPASGGLVSVAQLLHGCHLARMGETGMLAVRPFDHAHGVEWEIAGAVSTRPGASFRAFAAVDAAAAAAGVTVLSFQTQHAALSAMAQRHGYTVAGWVLRKNLRAS